MNLNENKTVANDPKRASEATGLPQSRPRWSRRAVFGLLLALVTLAVYLPVLRFDFICYDDPDYVTSNPPVVAGLTWSGVRWAFTQSHASNWHPVTWLSHMLDCQIYGLNPAGHHATNLLLHITNSLLLFGLLSYLTGAFWRSALVAALFALHPMHVESVAWISERKDVLSTLFFLLSLLAYVAYARKELNCRCQRRSDEQALTVNRQKSSSSYLLALLFFALGLMSKPMLVTLPFVLLLLDFWPLQRFTSGHSFRGIWRRLLIEKVPFLTLSAVSCVITLVVQREGGSVVPLQRMTLGMRMVNSLRSYLMYGIKLIWPSNLAIVYPYQRHRALAKALLAIVILGAITLFVLWQRRSKPFLLVGWLWYVGTLVPVIGLVQVGDQPMADRYSYIPAIGLFLMAAWQLGEFIARRPRLKALALVTCSFAVGAYTVVARSQLMYWQNSETLFRHAIAVASPNEIAYNHLGLYFASLHETKQAIGAYREALAINPNYQQAWNNLGCLLIDEGSLKQGIAHCQTALRLDPMLVEAHNNLGTAFLKSGRPREAIEQFTQALRLRPNYAQAHYNLANALVSQGDMAGAAEHYLAALEFNPRWVDALNNLGFVLTKSGKLQQAATVFRAALDANPQTWQARFGLAAIYAAQGRFGEAAELAKQASEGAQAAGETNAARNCRDFLGKIESQAKQANGEATTNRDNAR